MRSRLMIAAFVAALAAAACGGDDAGTPSTTAADSTTTTSTATTTSTDPSSTTTTTEAAPTRTFVGADGVETTIEDTSRIVSLNGDLTEIIFELGLGDRVVAVDVTTTYPPGAEELPKVGFGQQLAAEPVLAFQPTLVIGDTQIAPPEAIEQLRAAGVPVVILELATTLDGIPEKIRTVAEILDVPDRGETLAAEIQQEIDEAVALASQASGTPNVAFVYIRGPQTVFLFGQGMVSQALIEGANAVDAGASTGVRGAVPLTPEALVAAAPDVLVVPAGGLAALGGIDGLLAIPGVAETPAGQSRAILAYDEAEFIGFGPRTAGALRQFVLDLHPELAGS